MSSWEGKTESSAKVRRITGRLRTEPKEQLAKKPSYAEAGIATAPEWPVSCQKPVRQLRILGQAFQKLEPAGDPLGKTKSDQVRVGAWPGPPAVLGARGESFVSFQGPEEVLFGGDRKKHPNSAAVSLGSLLASHVGKAGGRTGAKYMKTCARPSGSVVASVNLIYLGSF